MYVFLCKNKTNVSCLNHKHCLFSQTRVKIKMNGLVSDFFRETETGVRHKSGFSPVKYEDRLQIWQNRILRILFNIKYLVKPIITMYTCMRAIHDMNGINTFLYLLIKRV